MPPGGGVHPIGLVAQRADVECAAAGGLQALGAIGPAQFLEPEAAVVALLGWGRLSRSCSTNAAVCGPAAPGAQCGRNRITLIDTWRNVM